MSYVRRTKYKLIDTQENKDKFLKLLLSKGFSRKKIIQLIYYGNPMSLVRWSNYLDIEEFDKYLEKAE